jgi:phosphoribosyl 1,2-cyclic phosphodiesterase
MLQNGTYPPYLKQRIRSNQGHLDNVEAATFLQELAHEKLQHVVLAHLSEENNCGKPGMCWRVGLHF